MNKQELIDCLMKKREAAENPSDGAGRNYSKGRYCYREYAAYDDAVDYAQQLDEPSNTEITNMSKRMKIISLQSVNLAMTNTKYGIPVYQELFISVGGINKLGSDPNASVSEITVWDDDYYKALDSNEHTFLLPKASYIAEWMFVEEEEEKWISKN